MDTYSAADRGEKVGLHGRSSEGGSNMRQDFDGSLVVRQQAAGVSWTQAGADTCPVRDLNTELLAGLLNWITSLDVGRSITNS